MIFAVLSSICRKKWLKNIHKTKAGLAMTDKQYIRPLAQLKTMV
jgi:hypothetical protein